jgi:formiminotetrahydrofolate cyclodeaminase
MLATKDLQSLLADLAAKQPTPGGGASAAIAVATGLATAAMAVAYTTGKKYAEHAAHVTTFQNELQQSIHELLDLADDDAVAYAALQATWRQHDFNEAEVARRQQHARGVPHRICDIACGRLAEIRLFSDICNRQLISDLLGGAAIAAGGARAAWATYLINQPPAAERDQLGQKLKSACKATEAWLDEYQ